MYMLTNYGGSGLQVVTPDPPDAGGAAINANFKVLATTVATGDPGADDDATEGFGVGSRWYNSATTIEWICLDAAPGAAVWAALASGALAGYLPLAGGTMAGALSMGGNPINMNAGGGTGGSTLNMDGGPITNCAQLDFGGGGDGISGVSAIVFADSTLQTTAYTGPGLATSLSAASECFLNGNNLDCSNGSGGTCGNIYNVDTLTFNNNSGATSNGITCPTSATLNFNANALNMNTGGGSGGGTLNMDGGNIVNATSIFADSGMTAYATQMWVAGQGFLTATPSLQSVLGAGNNAAGTGINMNTGGGSGGGTLNMDGGALAFDSVASAQGNGSGTLTFTGVTTVVGLPGVSSPTLQQVLSYGNNASGAGINMNTGGGTGGGTLDMDGGSVYGSAAGSGQQGGTWNLGDGSGSNGGTLNMDSGVITGASQAGIGMLTSQNNNPADPITVYSLGCSSFNLGGTPMNMFAGGGTGGGTLNMDGGQIQSLTSLMFSGDSADDQINAITAAYGPPPFLNLNANGLNMNAGGGSGGTLLNMDGGQINFNPDGTTPTNTTTPAGWIKIQINGGTAYVPYYA